MAARSPPRRDEAPPRVAAPPARGSAADRRAVDGFTIDGLTAVLREGDAAVAAVVAARARRAFILSSRHPATDAAASFVGLAILLAGSLACCTPLAPLAFTKDDPKNCDLPAPVVVLYILPPVPVPVGRLDGLLVRWGGLLAAARRVPAKN